MLAQQRRNHLLEMVRVRGFASLPELAEALRVSESTGRRGAVTLVEDGAPALRDGGSTTYEVARLLVGRPVHVVTNSLPVANLFAADANSDLVMIGGNICPRTGVVQ